MNHKRGCPRRPKVRPLRCGCCYLIDGKRQIPARDARRLQSDGDNPSRYEVDVEINDDAEARASGLYCSDEIGDFLRFLDERITP